MATRSRTKAPKAPKDTDGDGLSDDLERRTGSDPKKRDTDRDFFMSAAEAKAYGIVDEVLVPKPRAAKAK